MPLKAIKVIKWWAESYFGVYWKFLASVQLADRHKANNRAEMNV